MISRAELTRLAALARLSLSDSEQATLIRDLEAILGYVDQLKEVHASEKVQPLKPEVLRSNIEELKENVLREDGAPHPPQESRLFKVKAVFND